MRKNAAQDYLFHECSYRQWYRFLDWKIPLVSQSTNSCSFFVFDSSQKNFYTHLNQHHWHGKIKVNNRIHFCYTFHSTKSSILIIIFCSLFLCCWANGFESFALESIIILLSCGSILGAQGSSNLVLKNKCYDDENASLFSIRCLCEFLSIFRKFIFVF